MTKGYRPIRSDTPLPSPLQVRAWWDQFGMLPNIREHSEVVCRVALTLADWLLSSGVSLSRRAVEVGALAHDIAKTQCLGTERRHAQEGAEIVRLLGFPELAYIVDYHVTLPPEQPLDETALVNYADKRVTHTQVVSLDARYIYIMERYGGQDPAKRLRIQHGLRRVAQVEQDIFARLGPSHQPGHLLALNQDL